MKREELSLYINSTLQEVTFPDDVQRYVEENNMRRRGKVRDIFDFGEELLIVTTDRISAFDQVLTTIPCKGGVLNQLSLYWFSATSDIVQNHILEDVSGRCTVKG